MENNQKIALINGGTSGIGKELARLFARDFFNKAEMNESKAVQDKEAMAPPADVAKDGYEALMVGQDRVISGFENKVQVNMANLMPDNNVAHTLYEQQQPVKQEKQQQAPDQQ